MAPYREDRPVPESEWVLLYQGEGTYFKWSPQGEILYFLRSPGEFRRSIWALPFDRQRGKSAGPAFAVYEPQDWRITPRGDPARIGLSAAPGRIFFAQDEIQTNIWLAEAEK